MRICSIASGSSGNCIYVGDEHTHVLVDTGISKKRIEEGLKDLDVKGDELDGIFITHEHADHIQGLGVFSRKYGIPIYATKAPSRESKITGVLERCRRDFCTRSVQTSLFTLKELTVCPFRISHDANEPTGYRFENGEKSAAVATDLGIYDDYTVENLKGLDAILLEANHDIHMLEVGVYPYYLKQRVMGKQGHLSMSYQADFCAIFCTTI